jgi:hypothetical protein
MYGKEYLEKLEVQDAVKKADIFIDAILDGVDPELRKIASDKIRNVTQATPHERLLLEEQQMRHLADAQNAVNIQAGRPYGFSGSFRKSGLFG